MTSIAQIRRELAFIKKGIDYDKEVALDLDWDRIPEDAKNKILAASEVLSKYDKKQPNWIAQLSSQEKLTLIAGEKAFFLYAEPEDEIRRRRGPIH